MASVAIMVCGNQAKERYPGKGFWQLDGAVAAENILIAANGLGLGAVWTAIYPYQDRVARVQKMLGLPETVISLNIIPVGYRRKGSSGSACTTPPGCITTAGKQSRGQGPGVRSQGWAWPAGLSE